MAKDWLSLVHCWAGWVFSHKYFLLTDSAWRGFLVHFVMNRMLSGSSLRPTRERHAGRAFLVRAQRKKCLWATHLPCSWSSQMGSSTKRLTTGNPPRSLWKQMPRSYHNNYLHLWFKRLVQSLLTTMKDFPLIETRSKPCKERHLVWTVVILVMMDWHN